MLQIFAGETVRSSAIGEITGEGKGLLRCSIGNNDFVAVDNSEIGAMLLVVAVLGALIAQVSLAAVLVFLFCRVCWC